MRQIFDTVWQRRGTSWIWDDEARDQVCVAPEVWSLRQFLQAAGNWPDDLPSNNGQSLVVAGLEGSLDLLAPAEAGQWLEDVIRDAILSFQSFYESQAALIFWFPFGDGRLRVNSATDTVVWLCEAPHRGHELDFGRILWGEANEYPQEVIIREGGKPAGLFHLRIT